MKVSTENCKQGCDLCSRAKNSAQVAVKCGALKDLKHTFAIYETSSFYYYFSNLRTLLLGIEPPGLIIYYMVRAFTCSATRIFQLCVKQQIQSQFIFDFSYSWRREVSGERKKKSVQYSGPQGSM